MQTVPVRFGLILGAMKCGTSSLYRWLSLHPEVCHSVVKEPNFFADRDNDSQSLEQYRRLWSWDPSRHSIALEASTNYTKTPLFPNAAERIAKHNHVDWRFIYIMRNPINRIESHLTHGAAYGGAERVEEHHICCSEYARQIEAYTKLFGKEKLLLLTFDQLTRRTHEILRQTCRFLDIDPEFPFPEKLRSFNVASSRRRENRVVDLMRRHKMLSMTSRLVPTEIRRRVRWLIGEKIRRYKLNDQEVAYVLKRLRPDLQRLKSEFGIDAHSEWGIEL